MNDLTYLKPNELIGAIDQIEVSRTAKHLLNFFLQYAQKEIKFNNHSDTEFEVDVHYINGLADIHSHDYERLKKTLITLMQPVVLRDDPQKFIALTPVTSINIDVPNGKYKFELQPKLIDLLRQTDYFTKLELTKFNVLDSKYSIILFEYLKRYENAPKIPILSIDELKQITNTKNKYPNFTNFEKNVLKVAINEINEKTQYDISYEVYKTRTSRRPKVSEVQFYFAQKERLETEQAIESEFSDELFISFRKIFKNLPIEDYSHACESFERSTLVRYLNDLKRKDYGSLKTECFLRFLIDRTKNKWNGYFFKKNDKTPKEKNPGHASGSFGANEKFNFDEYMQKERQKFFDV